MVPRVSFAGVTAGSRAMGLVALLACTVLLAACTLVGPKFVKPDLTVAGVQLLGGNFLQQNIRLTLNIHNPNARALPVSALSADLQVGGETIARGVSSGAFVVPAEGDATCDVLVTANLAAALLHLANADQRSGAIDYDLSGVVKFDLPLLRSFPFHQHGSFSLTR